MTKSFQLAPGPLANVSERRNLIALSGVPSNPHAAGGRCSEILSGRSPVERPVFYIPPEADPNEPQPVDPRISLILTCSPSPKRFAGWMGVASPAIGWEDETAFDG